MVTGQCLCAAVSFEIAGPFSAPTLCHCGMCRRINGAPGAFTSAPASSYRIRGEESLNWYRSSADAERGFCRVCGSKLFWREVGGDALDVTMGSLDGPTGLRLGAHIWARDQGDYYEIGHDGVPRYAESSAGADPIPAEPAPDHGPPLRRHEGGCQCGAVHYRITGRIRDSVVCHCGQCRRSHGHPPGYSKARAAEMAVTGEDAVVWYGSSAEARRGFCGRCGSSLFWQRFGAAEVSMTAGSLQAPTGLKTARHIFAADKGDYYAIADGVRQDPGTMSGDPVAF
ncbi:MAG TPA: GFA family protein [Dongiaceae bacterium]|nr:GFA family protein [Dongiaceae bacterium]